MADREGQVTMADTQIKSLVSEQYLEGWSYDDEDSNEGQTQAASKHQTKMGAIPGFHVKRPHSDLIKSSGDSQQTEKKKFCMSLGKIKGSGSSSASSRVAPALPHPPSTATGGSFNTKPKISLNVGQPSVKAKALPVKMSLSSQSKTKETNAVGSLKKSSVVSKAFADSSDESEEEMPAEARMRMRNIGRETPTAAGPNSFGKSRLGFCDRQKILERELQTADD